MSAPEPIIVLRCRICGDTFPAVSREQACPSCGNRGAEPASEPLL